MYNTLWIENYHSREATLNFQRISISIKSENLAKVTFICHIKWWQTGNLTKQPTKYHSNNRSQLWTLHWNFSRPTRWRQKQRSIQQRTVNISVVMYPGQVILFIELQIYLSLTFRAIISWDMLCAWSFNRDITCLGFNEQRTVIYTRRASSWASVQFFVKYVFINWMFFLKFWQSCRSNLFIWRCFIAEISLRKRPSLVERRLLRPSPGLVFSNGERGERAEIVVVRTHIWEYSPGNVQNIFKTWFWILYLNAAFLPVLCTGKILIKFPPLALVLICPVMSSEWTPFCHGLLWFSELSVKR